jgi:hypothetical protein
MKQKTTEKQREVYSLYSSALTAREIVTVFFTNVKKFIQNFGK